MEWVYNPVMDSVTAKTEKGTYVCQRTFNDMSALWLDGEKLGTYGGGSHDLAKKAAYEHFVKAKAA